MAAKILYFADPRLAPLAVPIETLELDPDNESEHTEESVQEIVRSLVRFGWREPVGAVKSRRKIKTVIRGNRSLMAARWLAEAAVSDDPEVRAQAVGHESWWDSEDPPDWLMAPALFFPDDKATRVAWRVSHNQFTTKRQWNWPKLAENMADVSDEIDWSQYGWTDEELAELFDEPDGEDGDETGSGDPSDTPIPEPPADPETQPGDIWHLGDHRLICGDCRDPEVVARLLDGEVINVAFTSPPYASQRKYDESSGFKPIKPDDYVDWFEAVQANVRAHLAEDGSWFVNIKEHCQNGERHLYVKDLTIAHKRRWGWRYVDELVWERNTVPGSFPNRFKNGWEPVFHFSTTSGIKFRPKEVAHESKFAITYDPSRHFGNTKEGYFEADSAAKTAAEGEGFALPANILKCSKDFGGTGHSAPFPIGLPTFFVKAYSDPGDRVFDPFMGSGTVIIACEREDRIGYGCEVSRGYCDVIVMRWEAETGLEAQLERDGEIVAHEFPVAEEQPRKPGKPRTTARDGDKRQARRRVQTLVENGSLDRPSDLTCVDCEDAPASEYDHHLGYGAEHHEDVEALCAKCHHAREAGREKAPA